MEISLSIIVPMYNPGERLIPFLDSLLSQSYHALEIIIVDDGSTDGSREIANAYASQHRAFRVITQCNQGVSVARNTGLAQARGAYVAFPDADDILHPDLYTQLMQEALSQDLDAAQCNAKRYYAGSQQYKVLFPFERMPSTGVIRGSDWLARALRSRRFIHVVWLAVYRVQFIQQHQLFFEPGLHHQDIPWTTRFMLLAARVKYINTPLYVQNMHDTSISHMKRTGWENVLYQRHYIKIAQMLRACNDEFRETRPGFHWQIARELLSICHSARREPCVNAQRQIAVDFFEHQLHRMLLKECRGIKQGYQAVLWLKRLKKMAAHPAIKPAARTVKDNPQ